MAVPMSVVFCRRQLDDHNKLMLDYFYANPVYSERYFRRRPRIAQNLFLHIANPVKEHDWFFVLRWNRVEDLGHNTI